MNELYFHHSWPDCWRTQVLGPPTALFTHSAADHQWPALADAQLVWRMEVPAANQISLFSSRIVCYWQSGSFPDPQLQVEGIWDPAQQALLSGQTFRNLLEGKSLTILCHLAVTWLESTRVSSPCGRGQQTALHGIMRPRKGMRIHLPSPGSQDSSITSYSSGNSGCLCMSISDTYYVLRMCIALCDKEY